MYACVPQVYQSLYSKRYVPYDDDAWLKTKTLDEDRNSLCARCISPCTQSTTCPILIEDHDTGDVMMAVSQEVRNILPVLNRNCRKGLVPMYPSPVIPGHTCLILLIPGHTCSYLDIPGHTSFIPCPHT